MLDSQRIPKQASFLSGFYGQKMVFRDGGMGGSGFSSDTFSIAEKVSKKARLILGHLKSKQSLARIAQAVSDYIGILFGRFPLPQSQGLPDLLRIPK